MFATLHLHPTSLPARSSRPSPRPSPTQASRSPPLLVATLAMAERSREQVIAESIREIPDFPKPGIQFYDITTTLLDPAAFKACVDLLVERYEGKKIDAVAGFEARGLIFGAPLALALGCAFVPLRKPKKLPGETIGEEYELEYGSDRIEMHVGAIKEKQKVVLVDDLIATGGTMAAGARLMDRVGAELVEAAVVIELPDLKGREKLPPSCPLYVMVQKAGA